GCRAWNSWSVPEIDGCFGGDGWWFGGGGQDRQGGEEPVEVEVLFHRIRQAVDLLCPQRRVVERGCGREPRPAEQGPGRFGPVEQAVEVGAQHLAVGAVGAIRPLGQPRYGAFEPRPCADAAVDLVARHRNVAVAES